MQRNLVILALVMSLVTSQAAFAHAKLVSATPAIGRSVTGTIHTLELMFSEEISAKLSGATVKGSEGMALPLTTSLDKLGKGLAINLKTPLRPGVYSVDWHAVASDDGHRTSGAYKFKVE